MRHIALDIETLGKEAGCAIVTIGAVVIDDGLDSTFYERIDVSEGPSLDADTVAWWLKQSDKARAEIVAAMGGGIPLSSALQGLSGWMTDVRNGGEIRVWCRGPTFDITILESAYIAAGRRDLIPWRYNEVRDTRTLVELLGDFGVPFIGTPHHALHDAQHEARVILRAFERLGIPLNGNDESWSPE